VTRRRTHCLSFREQVAPGRTLRLARPRDDKARQAPKDTHRCRSRQSYRLKSRDSSEQIVAKQLPKTGSHDDMENLSGEANPRVQPDGRRAVSKPSGKRAASKQSRKPSQRARFAPQRLRELALRVPSKSPKAGLRVLRTLTRMYPRDPWAFVEQGTLYIVRFGDYERALKCFKCAAVRGSAVGMLCYGDQILHGRGVARDRVTGLLLVKKATEVLTGTSVPQTN